jgi:hypothetical protein
MALHLEQAALDRVATHLEALTELRFCSLDRYWGDVLGLLSLVLSELGRAAAAGGSGGGGLDGGEKAGPCTASSGSAVSNALPARPG